MRQKTVLVSLPVVILAVACLSVWGQDKNLAESAGNVAVVELEPRESRQVPLDGDHILIVRPEGEPQQIPVVLEKTTYNLTVVLKDTQNGGECSGGSACYELRSSNPQISYKWAFWSTWPLGKFQLLSNPDGGNYLVSVVQTAVMMVEVSPESRKRSAALVDLFTGKESSRITALSVLDVLDRELFLSGVDARNAYSVTVISVGRDKGGDWMVKVKGPNSEEIFTVVGDGTNWHAE